MKPSGPLPDKAMACLRASLSPAAKKVYKYSLGLYEADLKEPQCCQYLERILWRWCWSLRGATKIPSLLQQEKESINRSPNVGCPSSKVSREKAHA